MNDNLEKDTMLTDSELEELLTLYPAHLALPGRRRIPTLAKTPISFSKQI